MDRWKALSRTEKDTWKCDPQTTPSYAVTTTSTSTTTPTTTASITTSTPTAMGHSEGCREVKEDGEEAQQGAAIEQASEDIIESACAHIDTVMTEAGGAKGGEDS